MVGNSPGKNAQAILQIVQFKWAEGVICKLRTQKEFRMGRKTISEEAT